MGLPDVETKLDALIAAVAALDTKVNSIYAEVTTDVIWQVCCVCKGLGYLEKVYGGPDAHTDREVCEQCHGEKRVRFGEQQPTMPI